MNLEGSVIGNRYEILEKIGNGGMATVYKALDKILNRYVAVKILREEFTTDEEFIKRFNAEAQSAARLTHPNIVSVFDVGQEYNVYYIVMELIQGKTLKQIIDEDGFLSWKWSINIAVQIASALEMAHKNNIIHRDIKPHNIMITEDGVAKVTDFGIAKAVSNSTITAFGTTLGSVHYFSPEHARGGYTDSKSDLYSLGVVMYEMVTGKVPFDADTPVSIALKHMQEEPVEPKKINQNVPFAVNQIIMKALKKDPNDRYQNASEMIKDLNMALKRPEGGFIDNTNYTDGLTRRIQTIDDSEIKTNNKNVEEEEEEQLSFFQAHKKVIISGIIALVFLIVFIATLFITLGVANSSTPEDVQIPDVVGKTQEEARIAVENAKLKFVVDKEVYSADVPEGCVVSQDPTYKNNYSIKEGNTITVIISKGIELVKMPKVAGEEYTKAETTLTDLGLKIKRIDEISQEIPEGYIIKQETATDTEIEVGTEVVIHVSKGNGKKKFNVPDVVGKNREDAKNELTELGMEVTIKEKEDTSKSDGEVLEQSIEADSPSEEGTKITLTVNKIAASVQGTINVKVKALANKYAPIETPSEENEEEAPTTPTDKNITLKIVVNSDTIYDRSISRDTDSINQTFEGKGNVVVKVYINGIKVNGKDYTMDLNKTTVLNVN
ncbi:MAG: Stk1 family PASTA domain-containing Ser/Thr kinase [Clostridia bacterium]|nr:Stk1 family PASTA domain-containing Ser/Thr kinase [Clostridia bacterium]